MKSPLSGMKSPRGGMNSPLAGMNGPLADICTSGARVRHRVGGERTRAVGPAALKIAATRGDPRGLRCLAAGLQFPVPRADETGVTVQSARYRNGKEVKEDALL